MGINLDKPERWKEDIARSVDQYNRWFLKFAPKTYREERVKATEYVAAMLGRTNHLRNLTLKELTEHPSILFALRMSTAPPIARDRLVGLAGVSKLLVNTMEKDGRLPRIMTKVVLNENLRKIARMIVRLTDVDIFPWLGEARDPTEQEVYRAATIVADRGLGGLYTYFIVLSQAWMSKDGVGAWLIPSEFMDVNYGRKVKEFLTEKVTLHRIHRFDPNEVQFGDALVSSAVVFFKNALPPDEHEAQFTFGGTVNKPKLSDSIGLNDLRRIPKWTGLPQDASRLIHRRNGSTLSDLFTIKRGLATGCNSFFVLSPDQVEQLNLPKKFLKPILPGPRELVTDEIPADEDGLPQIACRRYLLSCDLPESEVESDYPMVWRYLLRGIERKVNEGYICSHRKPWYSQENRPPSPFLCTYMGRPTKRSESPFRFILNYSKATAANVYLMLYPKPTLAALLSDNLELYTAIWKALSSITAETLKGEGRVYGGGLHKLEPRELANVASDFILSALPHATELSVYRQQNLFAE